MPFLLPLMFRSASASSAFHAGILTLAVFAGNLATSRARPPILRRFGFKPVLVVNGILECDFHRCLRHCFARYLALVHHPGAVHRRHARPMHFTALNTIAFADIPPQQMTGANTLFSTASQLTDGDGNCIGAIGIRIGRAISAPLGMNGITAINSAWLLSCSGIIALLAVLDCLAARSEGRQTMSLRKPKQRAKKAA